MPSASSRKIIRRFSTDRRWSQLYAWSKSGAERTPSRTLTRCTGGTQSARPRPGVRALRAASPNRPVPEIPRVAPTTRVALKLRDWSLLLLCNLIWASQFVLVKLVEDEIGPLFTTAFPMLTATILLAVVVRWTHRAASP